MKAIIQQVTTKIPAEIEEIDIDDSVELRGDLADQIPLLCIDGRKAFKYRVAAKELERRLQQGPRRVYRRWFGKSR